MAALIIVVWGVSGPLFGFSDTWQLVINTGTTIVTFLMVFLIQNTQNRDSQAVHLKLDELIHSIRAAGNDLLDAEDMDDQNSPPPAIATPSSASAPAISLTPIPPAAAPNSRPSPPRPNSPQLHSPATRQEQDRGRRQAAPEAPASRK